MEKISIIIPVYNVEKYIGRCLDSIEKQKYENLEVIIVNDGSNDESELIIKQYLSRNANFRYYKKTNGGLSDARNYGIEKATGDYICFVDSDDYVLDGLFEQLQNYVGKKYDLIKFGVIIVDEDGNLINRSESPVFEKKTGIEAFNLLYKSDIYLQPAVLYLYRKEFWDNNKFLFPVGKYHEDFAVVPLVMIKANSVVSTGVHGYYYVQSSQSITRGNDENKKMQRAMDCLFHYDNMLDVIKKMDIDKYTVDNVMAYYTNCIILKLEELSQNNRKKYLQEIKRRKMFKNIKIRNRKTLIKRFVLRINPNLYLKMR